MTSSNGNIFRVTGHLCGKFTGPRWISRTKASDAELWCPFDMRPNIRLSKQSWGWWFETPPQSLWRHRNVMTHFFQIPAPTNVVKHHIVDEFLVGRQPLYDEIGAAARNIHCYAVIGFWQWLVVGLIVRIETLLAIVRHRIFILILGEYRLGLLGIEMYHGFKRLLNPTDSSFAHLYRYVHAWCKGCAWWLQNNLSRKDTSGGMAYLTQTSLLKKSKYCI